MSIDVHPRLALRAAFRVARAATVSSAMYAAIDAEQRLGRIGPTERENYVRTWARRMLKSFAIELHTSTLADSAPDAASPPWPGGRLVVANHRSMADIFVMLHLFGGRLLARGDMESWPAIGKMCVMAGTLFVQRSDAGSRSNAVRRIKEVLDQGRSVSVFAEGTTFPDDQVRPFHAGSFMAVARTRGSILPVGLAYADPRMHYLDEPFSAHGQRLLLAERIVVSVAVGSPIPAVHAGIKELADRSRDEVQRLVDRARANLSR